jgi:hypothetical protein
VWRTPITSVASLGARRASAVPQAGAEWMASPSQRTNFTLRALKRCRHLAGPGFPRLVRALGLVFAAERGHRRVVELLLEAKADVNALTGPESYRGVNTPLDYAEDAEVKALLIEHGGKPASEVSPAARQEYFARAWFAFTRRDEVGHVLVLLAVVASPRSLEAGTVLHPLQPRLTGARGR